MKTLRYTAALLTMLLIVSCGENASRNTADDDPEHQKGVALRNADQPDTSKAPGDDEAATPEGARAAGGYVRLRSDQVRTRHLVNGAITSGKLAIVATTVTVAAAGTAGSSAADPTLVGGTLIGCHPAGNQDQLLDNAVLNGDGSITLTLGAAATGINTFRCVSIKANAQGVT